MASRFNFPPGRRASYHVSFHDLAAKECSVTAVNCVCYTWAVIWGGVLMIVTGLMLWAHNMVSAWLPMVSQQLAGTIYFYKALLVTFVILTWHFYSAFFDPEVYSMDPVWLTGRSVRARVDEPCDPEEDAKEKGEQILEVEQEQGQIHPADSTQTEKNRGDDGQTK